MREIRRAMKDLSDSSKSDMKVTHRAVAEIVARQAKYEVPVRTGRLRSTIRTRSTLTQGRVVAGMARVPYAGPIHFGWPTRPDPSKRIPFPADPSGRVTNRSARPSGVTRAMFLGSP